MSKQMEVALSSLNVEVGRLKEMVGILSEALDEANERIAKLEKSNGRVSTKGNSRR